MSFHEIRFPSAISFGSTGGIERRTEIVTLVNGFEERNSPWSQSRRRYDAGLGVRSLDDLSKVLAFYEARHGQLYGFRWKDWLDFKSCPPSAEISPTDQVLVAGGLADQFQLVRRYEDAAGSYVRTIRKPNESSVRIAVDGTELIGGTEFSVDAETGVLTLDRVPEEGASVTAGFEFDVPVRFDSDVIDVNIRGFEAGEIPSIPIVEVRI
ncbi:MAG: DUF2460 domain-containing protein [Pseudomonadota bacterium]